MRGTLSLLFAIAALAATAGDAASPRVPGRIVFVTDRGGNVDNAEIYAVRIDGRGRRALSRNPGADGGAVWSPGGTRIAFWSERLEGGRRVRGLYVMRRDGSARRRLSPRYLVLGDTGEGGVAWSPDGRQIVFQALRGSRSDIWVVRADGSRLRRLAGGGDAVWSPQGGLIAIGDRGRLFVVPARGGSRRQLTRGPEDGFPAWSPDGRSLAFIRHFESRQAQALYTVPARGGLPRRIFGGQREMTIARGPQWSPDGQRILFGAGRTGSYVHIARVRDRALRRLRAGDWPAWSPDGRRIAFTVGSTMHVMNADGSGSRRVRSEGLSMIQAGPSWSPDGRTLLYATFRLESDLEIAVVNADGRGLKTLTQNTVHDWSPAWSPARRRIAFVRRGAVWLMGADGSGQRRLAAGGEPTWAPSGRELAFSTARGIEVVDVTGGAPRSLVAGHTPAWSPRGSEIAFVRGLRVLAVDVSSRVERLLENYERSCPVGSESESSISGLDWSPNGQRLIVALACDDSRFTTVSPTLVRADGGGSTAFPLDNSLAPTRLAFSPDGKRIAFVSESAPRMGTATLDGRNQTAVLRSDEGQVYDPDW